MLGSVEFGEDTTGVFVTSTSTVISLVTIISTASNAGNGVRVGVGLGGGMGLAVGVGLSTCARFWAVAALSGVVVGSGVSLFIAQPAKIMRIGKISKTIFIECENLIIIGKFRVTKDLGQTGKIVPQILD